LSAFWEFKLIALVDSNPTIFSFDPEDISTTGRKSKPSTLRSTTSETFSSGLQVLRAARLGALHWARPPIRSEDRPQKITLGEMRATGVRDLLIYCADYKCSHSTTISGDRWPDQVRLSDLEGRFVCRSCGTQDADVRPDFSSRGKLPHERRRG
jgi:hypothetical protein